MNPHKVPLIQVRSNVYLPPKIKVPHPWWYLQAYDIVNTFLTPSLHLDSES